MKKPTRLTNITIQLPDSMKPEEAQRMAQAFMHQARAQNDKDLREYEIYKKGLRDGSRGLFGVFGL